nr:uncharacterized mitochondrial protein AtMg00810-like [Tanacetum cinerariifolium]
TFGIKALSGEIPLELGLFTDLRSLKETWEAIKTRNLRVDRVKESRLQTLITKFKNMKMSDNDTIDAYAAKLSGIASKSTMLREVMLEHKLDDWKRMKKESKKKIKKTILKRICFMLGLNIPTGMMTQVEEEDVAHTLEVVDEVEVKDVVRTTRKTKVNMTHGKTVKIMNKMKLDSTLKNMSFLQCVHEKAVYRKVPNGEFIIVAINMDDLFVTGTSLDLINKFKRRMTSQFKMSDLGELTYYLGIKVSQGKDCVEIKQERYAKKILKEAGMEDCNATSYPMEKDLKLSKAEDEQATQYQKVVGCLRYLLHTRLDLTYSVGVVSRYMQSLRESHAHAINGSSHNVDIDDGQSTTGHVFYLGTSPVIWCSQKQTIVALSSCEAEFMAATAAACQSIWLRELLAEVTGLERKKVIMRVDSKSAIALSNNLRIKSRPVNEDLGAHKVQGDEIVTWFEGNSFEGSIPPSFSRLTALQELRITGLHNGTLDFIMNLKSLTILNLVVSSFTLEGLENRIELSPKGFPL